MNNESCRPKKQARVQFQDSDVFLSACMSGDEEEVEQLLSNGADINTCTVDGLTALHQSVIDSKPEMVRFLCEHGADVNAQDNEGWTPLHAASCCGNVGIVKYLCEHGADLAIINSDKELAIDLADDEKCKEFLEQDYKKKGINLDDCRDEELTIMMRDAEKWLKQGRYEDRIHDKTGAHAMHVAAAKGYTQLLELLIKAGGDVAAKDNDGWTPLMAAAHWAEKDSCKILIEHGASIHTVNHLGQNVIAVADKDIAEYLEELEATAEKKRNSPAVGPSASILHDKNIRVAHEEHTINQTLEHKRDLQHKDAASENEILHKLPRLETTGRIGSTETSSSVKSNGSPPDALIREEKNSPDASRSSEEREMSVASGSSGSGSGSYISGSGSQTGSSLYSSSQRSSSYTSESQTEPSNHSSSIHSSDQNVSATVTVPRLHQQAPNSWINRGVQLVTRSSSSSSTSRSGQRSEGSPLIQSSPSNTSLSATYTINTGSKNLPVQSGAVSYGGNVNGSSTKSVVHEQSSRNLLPSSSTLSMVTPTSSSALPWASLYRSGSSPNTNTAGIQRMLSGSSTSSFTPSIQSTQSQPQTPLQISRISAFRPLVKSQVTSSVPSEFPKSFQPQHLQPHQMRPWVSSGINESEAERRNNSRLQRQHRRSTQGVTKEQLEEASRIMNQERQNMGSSETSASRTLTSSVGTSHRAAGMPIRLASQERDSADEIDGRAGGSHRNQNGNGTSSGNVDTTMTLTLTNTPAPNHTSSTANMKRRSQAMISGPLARSNRRGTGPVLPEDVQAAVSASSSTSRPTSGAYSTVQSTGKTPVFTVPSLPISGGSTKYSGNGSDNGNGSPKSQSVPPPSSPQTITPTAAGLRGAVLSTAVNSPRNAATTTRPSSGIGSTSYGTSSNNNAIPDSMNSQHLRLNETNLNYKALWEKERLEKDRMRRELDDFRRDRLRNGASSASSSTTKTVSNLSNLSLDENERRALERRIAELEIQLKKQDEVTTENERLKVENEALSLGQVRQENQRLKEENAALISYLNLTISFNFKGKLNCPVNKTCKLPGPVFKALETLSMQAGPEKPLFGYTKTTLRHAAKNLENIVYELAGDENRDLPFSWKYLRKLYAAQMFVNNYLILKSADPGKLLTPEDVLSILNDVSKELSHTMKIPKQEVCSPTLTLRNYIDGLAVVELCAKEKISTQEVLDVLEKKLTFSHLGKGLEKAINAGYAEYTKNAHIYFG
ncbi:hypothetical protein WR25_19070 isoform A [Diploscapter pachys]|nr:hypothetical protein WR25_19070 isoform A [Diploscapter pachys]